MAAILLACGIDPAKSTEVLAVVGGEEITVGDFTLQKQNLQQQFARFGSQISLARMGYSAIGRKP